MPDPGHHRPGQPADLPRLHELSVRTHQFNSIGRALSEAEFARLLGQPRRQAFTVRLTDRFGDDGIVGGCVIVVGHGQARPGHVTWDVPLLMMSCRALGRGVIDAQLTWICHAARAAGAAQVALTCLVSPRNVPLRIALTGAGFRAAADRTARPARRGSPSMSGSLASRCPTCPTGSRCCRDRPSPT